MTQARTTARSSARSSPLLAEVLARSAVVLAEDLAEELRCWKITIFDKFSIQQSFALVNSVIDNNISVHSIQVEQSEVECFTEQSQWNVPIWNNLK